MRVLITDGGYKHTLAAVRALGREGVKVHVLGPKKNCLSFYSKYCNKKFVCSSSKEYYKFSRDVIKIVKKNNYDVLLPIGFNSTLAISNNLDTFDGFVNIPIANSKSMSIASDKMKTVNFARENNIDIPKTFAPSSTEEVEKIAEKIRYPVVIKALEEAGSVKYANTRKELIEVYKKECETYKGQVKRGKYPQIQEYISGSGHGLYALFNHGEPRAFFMHKRLHEFPPTGGPSVMAQSYFDKDLKNLGLKILKKLDWHGVAMVEFKKDFQDGKFKLIEINPKFWGSLDLSIESGVNFPYLACKMCIERDIEQVFDYQKNVIFRWLLPDFKYALATGRVGEYFINYFNRDMHDDLSIDDFFPNLRQFIKFPISILLKLRNKEDFSYPHGKPKRRILEGE
ncbi:MAG: ATP-grasp domain-containing protein [Candidatus Thermoplasmatota archaeon]